MTQAMLTMPVMQTTKWVIGIALLKVFSCAKKGDVAVYEAKLPNTQFWRTDSACSLIGLCLGYV